MAKLAWPLALWAVPASSAAAQVTSGVFECDPMRDVLMRRSGAGRY